MGQITIYLDVENEKRVKEAAKSAGVSVSRWVARLVEEKTRASWPEAVRQLAGAWPDIPDLESIRQGADQGDTRETL